MLSDATFYDRINTIDHFIKHLSDKKSLFFEAYRAFNLHGAHFESNDARHENIPI